MGRKSIAQKILENIPSQEEDKGLFLVMYDFTQPEGTATPIRFFENLDRIMAVIDGSERVQLSVIETESLRAAKAIMSLAKYYNARSVILYQVKKLEEYNVAPVWPERVPEVKVTNA